MAELRPEIKLDARRDEIVSEDWPQPVQQEFLQIGQVDGVVDVPERVSVAIPDRNPPLEHRPRIRRTPTPRADYLGRHECS